MWRSLCAVVLLAGCAATGAPETEPIAHEFDAGGVQLAGSPLRIDFGRTDHSTIPAMTRLVGSGPVSEATCGAVRVIGWPGDVTLFFTGGDFRGWKAAGRSAGVTCAGSGN